MKNKALIVAAILMVSVFSAPKTIFAYGGKKESVTIQTSAQCEDCEGRISKSIKQVDGIDKVKFNHSNKKVTVTYSPDKTNPLAIKTAINKAGYDADDMQADKTAYSNLPTCCQKPTGKK